jgi:hypothetical protein
MDYIKEYDEFCMLGDSCCFVSNILTNTIWYSLLLTINKWEYIYILCSDNSQEQFLLKLPIIKLLFEKIKNIFFININDIKDIINNKLTKIQKLGVSSTKKLLIILDHVPTGVLIKNQDICKLVHNNRYYRIDLWLFANSFSNIHKLIRNNITSIILHKSVISELKYILSALHLKDYFLNITLSANLKNNECLIFDRRFWYEKDNLLIYKYRDRISPILKMKTLWWKNVAICMIIYYFEFLKNYYSPSVLSDVDENNENTSHSKGYINTKENFIHKLSDQNECNDI